MINDHIVNEIKKHLKDYLDELGIDTSKLFTCLNPEHEDKNPSMGYYEKRNIIKCFSCNTSYDIISLYALNNNLDNSKDFKKIIEDLALKYNVDYTKPAKTTTLKKVTNATPKKKDHTKYINKCKKNIDKSDYLLKRGISKELIEKYNIGYDVKEHMIVLPISKTCYLGRYTDNSRGYKHHKPQGTSNEIFNSQYIKDSDFKSVVWVCESIIDALSLEETKKDIKAISLNSINNANQLVQEARDNDFKGVFMLAFDTDYNGIKASKELQEELEAIGIKTFIFNSDSERYNVTKKINEQEIKEQNKDINEYLLSDKDALKNYVDYTDEAITTALKKQAMNLYQQENILNYLSVFNENIKDREKNKPLSTGIKILDKKLDGGFYRKNLIILGAISSLGKTTLALQLGDNIARNGNDVLMFSLEMSKDELIARNISRNSFFKAYDKQYTALAFTTLDILKNVQARQGTPFNDQRQEIYKEAYEDYKQNMASNVYITECNDILDITIKTIDEKIKKHIAITNKKPFVIIDYLQIIQDNDRYMNDKQKVDKILTSLKRIARENDIIIFLISSLNRGAYTQEISLDSFKDSGNIEYTADVLLGLQLQTDTNINNEENSKKVKEQINREQQKDERVLTLKILKNRNGRITDIKDIKFHAKYNYMEFTEIN